MLSQATLPWSAMTCREMANTVASLGLKSPQANDRHSLSISQPLLANESLSYLCPSPTEQWYDCHQRSVQHLG
ncbi:hypothetical protein BaRGS_00017216, partial [Batillaria attramentaria]